MGHTSDYPLNSLFWLCPREVMPLICPKRGGTKICSSTGKRLLNGIAHFSLDQQLMQIPSEREPKVRSSPSDAGLALQDQQKVAGFPFLA